MKIAVLGAGAWGTALASALARSTQEKFAQTQASPPSVLLWGRDPALMVALAAQQKNQRYLPGIALAPTLHYSSDWQAVLAYSSQPDALIILATSVAGLRPTLQALAESHNRAGVIWLCKGLEESTQRLPHQVVAEVLGDSVCAGALSGPSFASEVAQGLPVALTFATRQPIFAETVVQALHSQHLRVYATDDVAGVEIGGAIKNILAIATGISEGLGLGLNARAAIITRGLAEMTRYGVAAGARPETFMGLAGVGDLILTCTGALSRNRKVGLLLAEGLRLPEILQQLGHVAEGVRCAQSVQQQAQHYGIEMPIVHAVCRVLFEGVTPKEAIQSLLARDPAQEVGSRI